MKMIRNMILPAMTVLAVVAAVPLTRGATIHDVTDWVVHNGSSTITNENTNNPAMTPAGSNLVVMAPTESVTLSDPNDYITFTAELVLTDRTSGTGVNALNTQLRFGIFSGPDSAVAFEDAPNTGFIGQYANANQGWARLRAQETSDVDPFLNGTLTALADGTADPEGDSISGANPPPIDVEMTITRNASEKLDIAGAISGGEYLSTFSYVDYESAAFPAGGPFTFNRAGFWFGGNVNATSSTVSNAAIETNVPEPHALALVGLAAIGAVAFGRARRCAS